jgi:hypothetical protein
MRTLAGTISLFTFVYLLGFVRLETRYAQGIILVAPGTTSLNDHNTFSGLWLLVPLTLGIYLIVTGELEFWQARRGKQRGAPPSIR